ncbi:MAG: hypothetical protein KDK36_08525 [Leptospiraceae bacterium]|nr:hypothetical protein [Leptospiraceae bacterium]
MARKSVMIDDKTHKKAKELAEKLDIPIGTLIEELLKGNTIEKIKEYHKDKKLK